MLKNYLRILIIEDEEDAALLLLRSLRPNYPNIIHRVVSTRSELDDALNTASWDLITCDFNMPILDPKIALETVRALGEETPFFLISGEVPDHAAIELMKAGAHDYVNKNRLAFLPSSVARELKEADIRRQKKASESELRISEKRFRDFVQAASDWYWETDIDHRFVEFTGQPIFSAEDLDNSAIGKRRIDIRVDNDNEDEEIWVKHLRDLDAQRPFKDFEYQLQDKGESRWVSINGAPMVNTDNQFCGYWGTGVDITQRKQAEESLSYQASHDALTSLINRHEFERRANRLISTTQKNGGEHALCFMDLDQFKVVNDTCGHTAGDELLRQIGHVLQKVIRHRDTLARLGGDEFGILMEHCPIDQAKRVVTELQQSIQGFQFSWEGQPFRIGVSMGLVAITDSTPNLVELMKQVDSACYMAKDLGRNRIHVYSQDDSEIIQRQGEMQWVARINQALDEDRFCLYAQPIISLDSDNHRHYEILVRMLDAQGGIIPPGAFLPAAERYSLIEKLDAWVVSHACEFLAQHPAFTDQIDFVTINLSGQSLTNELFLKSIFLIFKETGISPKKVCFEVTETAAVSNMNSAIKFIKSLKEIGCQFALDDFGSGISSFGYLKNLPVDYLKIDGMFVKDMVEDPIDFAMVKSINEIGQLMGMKTIAEFVENDEIKMKLKTIGVNYGQGYGPGRPEPLQNLII